MIQSHWVYSYTIKLATHLQIMKYVTYRTITGGHVTFYQGFGDKSLSMSPGRSGWKMKHGGQRTDHPSESHQERDDGRVNAPLAASLFFILLLIIVFDVFPEFLQKEDKQLDDSTQGEQSTSQIYHHLYSLLYYR